MHKVGDRGRLLCSCQFGGEKEHRRPFGKMKECEDRDRQEVKGGWETEEENVDRTGREDGNDRISWEINLPNVMICLHGLMINISMTTHSVICVSGLTYSYTAFSPPSLIDLSFDLPPGSRTILIGANGGLRNNI